MVLIVDASDRVRARLGERFAAEDAYVLHASGLKDALALVATSAVDAIVFDVHVDGDMGIDVLASLRRLVPKAVIVILTNEANELHRRECLRHGADFFFDKSLDFDRAVEAVLRSSRS